MKKLLHSTISKIRKHVKRDKQLTQQQSKIRMHELMEKTFSVTRKKNTKYVTMYNNQMHWLKEKDSAISMKERWARQHRRSEEQDMVTALAGLSRNH